MKEDVQPLNGSTGPSPRLNGWRPTPTTTLRCLSTGSSDHAPLLLQLWTVPWAKPRFRFEAFWVRMEDFEQVVAQAWDGNITGVDACRLLHIKLRKTAKALQS